MRKYTYIIVLALIASTVYFTSCERMPSGMMDTIMPDAETVEPPPEIPAPESMVLIPAGEFEMGSPAGEFEMGNLQLGWTQPVHTVYVDTFYMDTHEVTNLEYKRFLLANPEWQKDSVSIEGYLADWDANNNYPEGRANYPVRYVPWLAAVAYAELVGKRLPTEAEWEKAARGGLPNGRFPLGDTPSNGDVENAENHLTAVQEGRGLTPVGSYEPNGYGLYDMSGNVLEFCLDEFDQPPGADPPPEAFYSISPTRNPLNTRLENKTIADLENYLPGSGYDHSIAGKVVRGERVFSRGFSPPGPFHAWPWHSLIGFRCVKDVAP